MRDMVKQMRENLLSKLTEDCDITRKIVSERQYVNHSPWLRITELEQLEQKLDNGTLIGPV